MQHNVIDPSELIIKPVGLDIHPALLDSVADQIIEIPLEMGVGQSYLIDFDNQNKLMLSDIDFCQRVSFASESALMCGVFIVLEGELELEIGTDKKQKVGKDSAGIFFVDDCHCQFHYPQGRCKLISFTVNGVLMASLAEQYSNSPLSTDSDGQWRVVNSIWTMPLTPHIVQVIEQVYTTKLKAQAKRLYIQAKVMEILALVYDWKQQRYEDNAKQELKSKDLQSIISAAKLIEKKMANPPSIIQLSKLVGINDHKLKVEFKRVFQCTVFDYLNQKRMDEAKRLLINTELNVRQVASAIGFKHLGYFSAKFKKHYQIAPAQFIKKYRVFGKC